MDLRQYYTEDKLALVGIISAIVHILLRGVIEVYPKHTGALLNLMLVVNVLLALYYGMALNLQY
jgi:hypothetical protein